MTTVTIQDAASVLPQLVQAALGGEDVTLAAEGTPLVRLVPCEPRPRRRTAGQLRGQGWEAPDCWTSDLELLDRSLDAPLPGESPNGNSSSASAA